MTARRIVSTVAAAGLASGVLLVGTGAPPAAAASNPQIALQALKDQWGRLSPTVKQATCQSYAALGDALVAATVAAAMKSPPARQVLTRAQWSTVVKSYYVWACPGGRPR